MTDQRATPFPTLIFGGGRAHSTEKAEVTFREARGPEAVATVCRAALFSEGLTSIDMLVDANPLRVPIPLLDTAGVPFAVASERRSASDPRAVAVGRFSAYLSVVEAVGTDQAYDFGEHLTAIMNLFGSWGDPVLWATVAEKVPPLSTPPEWTAVRIGAAEPPQVGPPSQFCVEDMGGIKYVPGAAEALRYTSMDEPERHGDPVHLLDQLRDLAVGDTLTGTYPTGGFGTEFTIRRLNTSGGHKRRVAPSLWEREAEGA